MEPFLFIGVPGYGETLHLAAFKGHEVLLQRCISKSMGDLKIFEFPSGSHGVDVELTVLTKHTVRQPIVFKFNVIEITQYGSIGSNIHGQIVMGAQPQIILLFVTFDTGCPAHELGPGVNRSSSLFNSHTGQVYRESQHNNQRCNEACYLPMLHVISA